MKRTTILPNVGDVRTTLCFAWLPASFVVTEVDRYDGNCRLRDRRTRYWIWLGHYLKEETYQRTPTMFDVGEPLGRLGWVTTALMALEGTK